MNSMLRQHHLRIPDVKGYLRVFDKSKPSSPTDWAAQESMLYEPGYLIFCLEQVAAPTGLSTFSKKTEDAGDTFRVKDLCIVISKDEGQCMVVNVSASAYEFRVFDALLQEKATRAILDDKDFSYLACRPMARLNATDIKALYKVGSNYAQGGSRRSLTVEGSTMEEPLIALLGQLGAKVTTQVGKPLLDIGAVCHMIFTPEGRQDDKNKSLLKACFAPIKEEELALGELALQHGLMTEQAIRAEQAITPTVSAFDQGFTTPLASQQEPIYEPVYEPIAPPAATPAPAAGQYPAAANAAMQPNLQPSFDIPPAMQQVSYTNLQLPPQSEINAPSFTQNLNQAPAADYAYNPNAAFNANPAFVPSTPAPAPELPAESSQQQSRYDDTPPWATASADALTAVLIAGDNRIDQQLTTVKMAPPWYAMSHDPYDAPSKSATAVLESSLPKEDFSAQFFNDYQQGFAGEAAVGYAESEFEKERRIKEEFERGKQERLKQHFGDHHYDKFVKGGANPPAKVDSWDLNPSTYTTPEEPVKDGHFDSPIFENAARGTIETNPEALLPEPPAEEPAPANPDAWMDYQPPGESAPVLAPSLETLTAGGDVAEAASAAASAPPAQGLDSATPPHTPGLIEALSGNIEASPDQSAHAVLPSLNPTNETEWSTAVESSFSAGEPIVDVDSTLFERLTQQLSKDSPADAFNPSIDDQEEAEQVWNQGTPVSDVSAPMTNSGGGFWSNMDPNTSLFNPAEGDAAPAQASFTPPPAPLPTPSAELPVSAAVPAEQTAEPVVEPVLAKLPVLDVAPPAVESQLSAAPLDTPAPSNVSQVAPESAATATENLSDSQVMQTRVRPRDYSSPLRRSTELGGSSANLDNQSAHLSQAQESSVMPQDAPVMATPTEATNWSPELSTAITLDEPPTRAGQTLPPVEALEQESSMADATSPFTEHGWAPASQQAPLTDVPTPKTVSAVSPLETKVSISDAEPVATPQSIAQTAGDFTADSALGSSLVDSSLAPEPIYNAEVNVLRASDPISQEFSDALNQPIGLSANQAPEPVLQPPAAGQDLNPVSGIDPNSVAETNYSQAPAATPESPTTPTQIQNPTQAPSQALSAAEPATTGPSTTATPAPANSWASSPPAVPAGEFDSGVRKAPPAQDTRLMMNEMATLMSKLEQQVAKAANKMSSRAEELKIRLNRQVEALLREAQDLEKHAEVNLTNLSSELRGRLDNLAVEVHNTLSKESEGGRSLLSDLDASGLESLEAEQRQLSTKIIRDCSEFKTELEKLTLSVQTRLNNLIASRNDELAKLSESILEQLKESHDSYSDKVTQRFDRFRERMLEENSSITQSLERNMRSMVEEIDSSLDRACEKLRSTKLDLEQTISHTMAVSEMAVAQKTKQLLADTLLPRLNEQKEILRTMIHDMSRQIASESNTGLISELARLDSSVNRSSEELKHSVEECLSDLESSGRGLKSGLEETFKRSSLDLMQRTQEVAALIKDTERRMLESDLTLKSLADSSSVDTEPELNEERNHALSKLGSLKQQANKDLAKAIESSIETMENESEKLFGELTNRRADFTATVRDTAELNLDRVRQALSAATSAIQTAREKHME